MILRDLTFANLHPDHGERKVFTLMNLRIRSPRTVRSLLIAITLFASALASSQTSPTDSPAAARMRVLNNALLNVHGQMQHADTNSARTLRSQAGTVIAQRATALAKLIQSNPHEALSFALSPELLADLSAKFPQSVAQLESHTTVTGPVQHWVADYPGFKSSRSIWQMTVGGRSLYLHFAQYPVNVQSDQVLQATGVVLGSDMAVESSVSQQTSAASALDNSGDRLARQHSQHGSSWPISLLMICGLLFSAPELRWRVRLTRENVRTVLQHILVYTVLFALVVFASSSTFAQNACTTKGVQNTLVILVNLPNGALPAGVTVPAMQDVFFAGNTPGSSLDGFLREASYGQASATGQVVGPFNLTGTYTSCSDVGGAVLNDAIAATVASGVNLNNYTRVFLVFPDIFACGWAGFASNSCTLSTTSGSWNASVAFQAAAYATPRSQGVQVASHELGHNMGLFHSGTIASGTDILGPITSPGAVTDMGDYWSTMGSPELGLYPAPQKAEVLGWMPSGTSFQTVQSSGTFTVQPLEANPGGLQALKVQRGTGNNEWLWIEYRQPLGNYDSTLFPQPFTGALIHYEDASTTVGHTYLPNFTPTDLSGNSPALAAGQTWTDPYSNLSVAVLSASSTGLTVNVNYGAAPCTAASPTVAVSPLNPSIYPGQSASYSAVITNNDSSACSSTTINLGSSEPSGWSTSLSALSVTLSPGQSTTVTMGKGAPMGTPAGTYAVNLSATKNSSSTSGAANATVMAPPSMSISLTASGSTFVPPATVSLTALVLNGGVPASGTNVTFAVTTPSGATATQGSTTNSSGIATWNYKVTGKSTSGTYYAVAKAGLSSGGGKKGASSTQSTSSGSISFVVQ